MDEEEVESDPLPTLHTKLLHISIQNSKIIMAISRFLSPAIPQFKAQERGGRLSPTSETLGSRPQVGDLLDDVGREAKLSFKPIAGIAGYK